MKTIYLVRHGESASNAGQATDDPGLIPLTDLGEAQARQLAAELDIRPQRVITSEYVRAIDTAKPFCGKYKIELNTHRLLHEFTMLDPQEVAGTTNAQRRPLVKNYWEVSNTECRMGPGAETFSEFANRVDGFLNELDSAPNHTVVFGHGIWFALLLWRVLGFTAYDDTAMRSFRRFQLALPMPNCAVYELHSQSPHAWRIQVNETILNKMAIIKDVTEAIQ